MNNDKKSKGVETGGILFALFLLFLGAFALLFDVSLFAGLFRLFAFWPLLLVGLGVWLIFKNVNQEKVGVIVLAVILVAAMYNAFSQVQPLLEMQDEKTVPPGVTRMDVSMDLLFGTFSMGSTPDALYTYTGLEALEARVYTKGDTANLDFSLREEAFIPFRWSSNEYRVLLNQHLPMSLIIDTGVSSCSFDLSDLQVEEVILDGGISSVEITFGQRDTAAVITMGISNIEIYVPKSVGVKIISEGLLSLSVPPDWVKVDGGYKSPNYDTASYTIEITCDVGIGSVTIAYV